MKTRSIPHTIGIVSLGCAKNLVDTEVLMKQLDASEFRIVTDPSGTDNIHTAIINTCGFILDAKNESIDTILQFAEAKAGGSLENLYVMGCLSERYRTQLQKEIPEVDAFYGVNELKDIVERVGGRYRKELLGERILTTPSHYAYLKIAEGCDRHCSFCAIPSIRGRHISKPMEDILAEARRLVGMGVKEINVISQDTTYYGIDLYRKRMLPALLEDLAGISGLEWIRLHYTYPEGFPPELTDVISRHDNLCKYIDIPFQHISSKILKSMKRGAGAEEINNLISLIRKKIPGGVIRTTLITGYPGETDEDFIRMMEFIKQSRFDRLGIFTYSHEKGTEAGKLRNSVPLKIKQKRASALMELQESISLELNEKRIGQRLKIVIDSEEHDNFVGRTEYDSPEVDNEVIISKAGPALKTGSFYQALVTSAGSFELHAEIQV